MAAIPSVARADVIYAQSPGPLNGSSYRDSGTTNFQDGYAEYDDFALSRTQVIARITWINAYHTFTPSNNPIGPDTLSWQLRIDADSVSGDQHDPIAPPCMPRTRPPRRSPRPSWGRPMPTAAA